MQEAMLVLPSGPVRDRPNIVRGPGAVAFCRWLARYNAAMLSPERIQAYRSMSPEERWREVEELMTLAWRTLRALPREQRERRLALIRAEHEASDAVLLARSRELE